MKKNSIFFIITLLFISLSCIQMRLDKSVQKCPLHKIEFKKAIVDIEYGRGCNEINTDEYPYAKKIICTDIGRSFKKARIYYCDECTKIKDEVRTN
jgi:hypothetical protein